MSYRRTIRVLDEDPELAANLPGPDRRKAHTEAVAEVAVIRGGRWSPPVAAHESSADTLGLLVLDGVLARHVADTVELLMVGDLLQPWQSDSPSLELAPGKARWDIVASTRLAVLDRRFTQSVAAYPEVLSAIVGRGIQGRRSLVARLDIAQEHPLPDRLLRLLWHFADRIEVREEGGVLITPPLTQGLLAKLASARRSPVNRALSQLGERGLVEKRRGKRWFLRDAPEELERIHAAT